ncbi:MAG TPA: hypothetical protein VMU06_01320 [Stellaceae bacterium]|nr:hypothetical protein [Stellaceae bacterium]
MTDTTPTSATPPPAQSSGFTAGQIGAAREQWVKAGLDPSKFDAALKPSTPPVLSSETAQHPVMDSAGLKQPSMSDVQAHEMADALVAAGVPADAVTAAMKADGLDVPEAKTPEQIEHDKGFGLERAFHPSEYRINYVDNGGRAMSPAALVELNARATQWLANLRIDPALGTGLIEHALRVGYLFPRMSDAQRGLFKREQVAIAERRLGGSEQVKAAAANVNRALSLGDPGFANTLMDSGALHDSFIFQTLANHGARLMRWAETAPKKGDLR